jgi:Tol biopolymer transport system component/tRNA A-37 threonylcarbamoyl transferase component Bud32
MNTPSQLSAALAGRYAIDREIGAGGMATVYLARDVRHDRRVALKVLKPELGALLGVERFLAEIKVTANLQHPNLLPLFDSGEAEGLLYYVMPYVEGESLRARLAREKQLPVNEAVRMAIAIASALDYAHRHGVIHRDLKPENILLHEGQPLVADFGIALAVSNAGGNRITQTGLSLGTPQYMSPEQATGDRVIDGRTDVYSLGAVLYEMLTGDPPHYGSTSQAIIARVLTEKPRSVRATRESVPEYVDAAVERALAKLPADRWATAQEFAEALNNQRAFPTNATAPSSQQTRSVSTGSHAIARRAAVWLLPALALVVVAVAMRWLGAPRAQYDGITVRYPLNFAGGERFVDAQGVPMALSPDGSLLVYVATQGGHRSLYLRRFGELDAHMLPGTEDGGQPFFSPDGKWIGFIARTQLKKISIDGGGAIPLADVQITWGASWYRDDQIVASTRGRLVTIPAAGGAPHVFLTPDTTKGEGSYRFPLVLDDGKTVVFTLFGQGGVATARIGVASIDGGRKQILDLPGTDAIALLDGRLVYANSSGANMAVPFDQRARKTTAVPVPVVNNAVVGSGGPLKGSASRSGSLVYLSGSSTEQVIIAGPRGPSSVLIAQPGRYAHPRLSPDGRRLALEVSLGGATEIYIFDIASGTLAPLTTDGSYNANPEWTPDGKRVLYSSMRDGRPALWWQAADQSGLAERLVKADSVVVHEGVVSRDGRTLVVHVDGVKANNDLWYRGMTGDTTMKPLVSTPFNESGPQISPDGRWLAFASDESGVYQVYLTSLLDRGGRYQVSTDGGATPVWSPDGRRLYYTHTGGLVAANLSFAPTFTVTARETMFETINSAPPSHANFDVTPDGKRLIMLKSSDLGPQLIVVRDWNYELRDRTGVSRK